MAWNIDQLAKDFSRSVFKEAYRRRFVLGVGVAEEKARLLKEVAEGECAGRMLSVLNQAWPDIEPAPKGK